MMTLDVLSSAVPLEMVSAVARKDTTKSAWETIKMMRVGDDCIRLAAVQHLLHQFETAEIKEEESIEDYSMRLSSMVQHLATLGEIIAELKVVSKFLRSVPHKYKQIIVAIQTLLDVKTLTLANVLGWLKATEDELEAPPASVNHAGKLYLPEEAWEEKWKLWKGPVVADRVAEAAAMVPIGARVVAMEMARTIVTPAVQLYLDRARWVATNASSAAEGALGVRSPVQAEEGSSVWGSRGVVDADNRHTTDRATVDAGD
jgi:hypothetical protein